MKKVSVRLPKYLINILDELVEAGEFSSKADILREASVTLLSQVKIKKRGEQL